jgi:hypothetical protein
MISTRVRKIANSDSYIRHVCTQVRMEQLGPTGRIFMKFDIWVLFSKICRENSFFFNLTRITGTFRWRPVYIYDYI